jgi:serine/threonine protein kinase
VDRKNAAAAQALQQELEVMQRLRGCPHVVQIVDAFADEQYCYVVMELCYGLDLVDAIQELVHGEDNPSADAKKHMSHIAAVFREMVTAVLECHANNVYHMDIKPENFIHVSTGNVDGRASVKLLDFGLAWVNVNSTPISPGTRLGCSKYLAPEVFKKGLDVAPEAVDMYALGVSLFNLFTGKFPYPFYRMGRPRSRPDLSCVPIPEARDLIERLLARDPSQRPKAKDVLQHPFLQMHADAQVLALAELKGASSVQSLFVEDGPSSSATCDSGCAIVSDGPRRGRKRTLEKGEILFSEGDCSRAVYFVSNGSFNVSRNGTIVSKVQSDSVLGEVGALFNRPRNATVVAAEDAEIFELEDFGETLGSTQQRYASRGLQEIALKHHLDETTRDFLKSSLFFRNASDELLNMIVAGSDRAFFSPGDTVQEEALYIVQDGLLEVHRGNSSSAEFVGPGELAGESALLSRQDFESYYSAQPVGETLKALKPTTTVVLDRSEFALILSEFPKEREIILKSAEWRWKEPNV